MRRSAEAQSFLDPQLGVLLASAAARRCSGKGRGKKLAFFLA
jgi:hypothetical protein